LAPRLRPTRGAARPGATAHAGHGDGGIFTTTADPDYQVILAWIAAGVRE
jgi:hypothetical protein